MPEPVRLPDAMAPPAVDCSVNTGWYPLLVRLHRQLTTVTEDFTYVQIKEKFGVLRCYVNYGDSVDEFTRGVCELLIDASVEESSTICELCGRRGRIRTGIARVRTACESCFRGVDMQ